MRTNPRRTAAFKREHRRERKGRFTGTVDAQLARVVAELAADWPLAPRHRDHALGGQWRDHRDCHVRSELVLIYRKSDTGHLDLVRLSSHSELGL